jgi:hypothetical protein
VGRLTPGTSFVDIILQCYEVLSWQKVTMREDDALNIKACAWARNNPDRIPVDDRPILGRKLDCRITEAAPDKTSTDNPPALEAQP